MNGHTVGFYSVGLLYGVFLKSYSTEWYKSTVKRVLR